MGLRIHRNLVTGDLEDFGVGTSGDIYTPVECDLVTCNVDTWRTFGIRMGTSLGLGDLGSWRTLDTPAEWEFGI